MCEFEKNKTTDGGRKEMQSQLEAQCDLSSKNELRSIKCERDVDAMKFAEYMSQHIGEEFDGFVSSVSPFGLFVQLPNTIEGLIKLVNLKNDFYTFDDKTNELIGKKTGLRFSLGTKLKVKVLVANKETRKIEFELVKHLGNR
jgi:ribonuclease R